MQHPTVPPTHCRVDAEPAGDLESSAPAVWALLAFLLALILRPADLVPALSETRLTLLLFLLALLAAVSSRRRIAVKLHAMCAFALGLLIVMAFSVPGSYEPHRSVETVIVYAKHLALFALIIHVVRRPCEIAKVVWILVVAHAVHAAFLTKAYLMGEVFRGRASGIVGGVFHDPNDLALNLVIMLPLAVWVLKDSRRKPSRLLAVASLFLILLGIFAAQSRGGFLGAVAVLALTLKSSTHRLRAALVALAVALCLMVSAPAGSFERLVRISDYLQDESSQIRLHLWRTSLRMWSDHPITGVGAGAFVVAYGNDYIEGAPDWQWRTAHNSPLLVAVELGTPGLILWLGMIAAGFSALYRAGSRWASREETDPEAAPMTRLATALRVALIGYLVCSMFLSRAYDWFLMILLALSLVCWQMARDRSRLLQTPGQPSGRETSRAEGLDRRPT